MLAAVAFTLVLALLAVFQLALILGAPWGHFAWGGADRILPSKKRIGSAISILIYALMAVVALDRAGVIAAFPDVFSAVAMWVIFGYSVLGVLMNAISGSRLERLTMVPVSAVLSALSFLVAVA